MADDDTKKQLDEAQARAQAAEEETARVKSHNERLTGDLGKLKERVTEMEVAQKTAAEKAEAEKQKALEASGDVEKIKKSLTEKYEKQIAAKQAEYEGLVGVVGDLTAGQTARDLAGELSIEGAAKGLLPHIQSRLRTEFKDGKPTVQVLDADGSVTGLTPDDLKSEIRNTPYLKHMIAGSKASGGDTRRGEQTQTTPTDTGTISRSELAKMSAREQAAFWSDEKNKDVRIGDGAGGEA